MHDLSIRINPEVRGWELLITIPDSLMPTRSRPTLGDKHPCFRVSRNSIYEQ